MTELNELGRWVKENLPQKKLSWLQKANAYDGLKARCDSAESMRDFYKDNSESWSSVAIAKSRELELMTKVADNWQEKCARLNEEHAKVDQDYVATLEEVEQYLENIGRRLRFDIGHTHYIVIVGNPVTYAEVWDSGAEEEDYSVSICSEKDDYDWKIGVIKAVEKLCDGYSRSTTKNVFDKMFTKYPELKL